MAFDKCAISYVQRYSIIQNIFTALKMPCTPPICPFPSPLPPSQQLLATTDLFAIFIVLPFLILFTAQKSFIFWLRTMPWTYVSPLIFTTEIADFLFKKDMNFTTKTYCQGSKCVEQKWPA